MSDITIAGSSKAFTEVFDAVRDGFTFHASDSASFSVFTASYAVALHLEDGSLALNDDNTIEVKDVDVVWDTLTLTVCFSPPPTWCVPSFCIVPDPWNGCLVGFPGFCLLPTVCVPLDLSGLVSKITDLKASLVTKYYVDPARLPGWSDLDAEFNGHPNKWQVFVDPVWVHVDPIDIPLTIENLLENAIHDAIDNAIPSWVPGFIKDLLWLIIGPILDAIDFILEGFDSIAEWLQDLLGTQFDLLGQIETAVADYFASQTPIYEFEDPYPVLPASGGLIPVKIPIRDLAATVNSKEMVVNADVG